MRTVSSPGTPAELPVVPRYLRPKDAETYTGIALKTLEALRRTGKGPPFSVVGRSILYDVRDLDAFLAARRLNNTAQAVALQAEGGAA